MNNLNSKAIRKADEIRRELGLDIFEPINIFDACIDLGLSVRFVDINMEGMYINQEGCPQATILVSCQRPLPRRVYTCGHELGHHVFEHGVKVDSLSDTTASSDNYEELLVDIFAGALLMPIAGVQMEFAKRRWNPQNSSPLQFYKISSVFNTGFQTLVTHCRMNRLIDSTKSEALQRFTPAKIFKQILNDTDLSYFKIIDGHSNLKSIDLEVSNYIFLPKDYLIESDHLVKIAESKEGICYIAQKAGITRVSSLGGSSFVRIQKHNYAGLADYRHLEN